MASHYTQYSETIDHLTADEAVWLADQLDPDRDVTPDWFEGGDSPDFDWEFEGDSLALWSMDGSGLGLEQIGGLVREFLNRKWKVTSPLRTPRPCPRHESATSRTSMPSRSPSSLKGNRSVRFRRCRSKVKGCS